MSQFDAQARGTHYAHELSPTTLYAIGFSHKTINSLACGIERLCYLLHPWFPDQTAFVKHRQVFLHGCHGHKKCVVLVYALSVRHFCDINSFRKRRRSTNRLRDQIRCHWNFTGPRFHGSVQKRCVVYRNLEHRGFRTQQISIPPTLINAAPMHLPPSKSDSQEQCSHTANRLNPGRPVNSFATRSHVFTPQWKTQVWISP